MKPITLMLILSACIHIAVLSLLAFSPLFSARKIHVPIYPVTLITQAAPKPAPPKAKVTKKPTEKPKEPKPKEKVVLKKKPVKKDIISEKRVQQRIASAIEKLRKKLEAEEKQEVAQVAPKTSRAVIDMRLRTYYNMIWQRIKEVWILPEGLLEEVKEVPVIIIKVGRDGGIVESWFEKKSGSTMYDESAMRAIKKAHPLPPFPQELEEDVLEIGIRFHPE